MEVLAEGIVTVRSARRETIGMAMNVVSAIALVGFVVLLVAGERAGAGASAGAFAGARVVALMSAARRATLRVYREHITIDEQRHGFAELLYLIDAELVRHPGTHLCRIADAPLRSMVVERLETTALAAANALWDRGEAMPLVDLGLTVDAQGVTPIGRPLIPWPALALPLPLPSTVPGPRVLAAARARFAAPAPAPDPARSP